MDINLIKISGNIIVNNPIKLVGSIYIGSGSGSGSYPFYEGEYVVVPKVYEQALDTKETILLDNVTVKEITKHVFDNEKGLTVQIGEI